MVDYGYSFIIVITRQTSSVISPNQYFTKKLNSQSKTCCSYDLIRWRYYRPVSTPIYKGIQYDIYQQKYLMFRPHEQHIVANWNGNKINRSLYIIFQTKLIPFLKYVYDICWQYVCDCAVHYIHCANIKMDSFIPSYCRNESLPLDGGIVALVWGHN